jgi:GTP cyclohydrolase I
MCENCNNKKNLATPYDQLMAFGDGPTRGRALETVYDQLMAVGDDPTREGILETPKRVVKMWDEIYKGYKQNPEDIFKTFDKGTYDQMVVLRGSELYSMCEHHMLPFFGKVHVAYIPNEKVIGISKLARLVDIFSKRLQIQERIGEQVTTAIMKYLKPKGAACVIEATHLCMKMRGVEKQNSIMVTSSLKGEFLDNPSAKQEFLTFIQMTK